MCGIAGVFARAQIPDLERVVGEMTDTMMHRGPDDRGVWCDRDNGLALGQRRLAIIDLSAAGHQPMTSSCGRFTLTYNGEVYNAAELRRELMAAGRSFRGHSDTEVIVEGCAVWGLSVTVGRLIGMFAIAVWDAREKCLSLVRDRLGIKPLYWSLQDGSLLFGSELKALRAFPGFDRTIDRDAVVSYLRHNYIPAPKTIYRHAKKLEPGWLLSLKDGAEPKFEQYWSLSDAVVAGQDNQLECSDEEAVEHLEVLLGDAVGRRMISDVPLGAFLSGGIDSSTVVALMQKRSASPIKTFSIGFNVAGYNEAPYASEVARHLGTDHTELYVDPSEARDVIPRLATIYDEPFSDSSQIPTYLICELTRRKVTVTLSGDGGDEVFAGYNRYVQGERFAKYVARAPRSLRGAAAGLARVLGPGSWDRLLQALPALKRIQRAGDKIHKLADALEHDEDGFYRALATHWQDPAALVIGGREDPNAVWASASERLPEFVARMQYLDTLTYLPDDILTKVDRASMAVSLEARVPLLDHRVVELAWQLPQRFKIRRGESKWILRQLLYRHVPRQLVERPKMGFGVPIDHWLRGPLKDWAETLLCPHSLTKHGLIDPGPVRRKWAEHLDGRRNWQYLIWDILMLQQWCEEWC